MRFSSVKTDPHLTNNFIQISDIPGDLLPDLKKHFSKRVNNWFVLQQKNKNIPIEQSFISKDNIIPIGLWKEATDFAEDRRLQLNVDQEVLDCILDPNLTLEDFSEDILACFEDAVNSKGAPFRPYDYQIKSAYQLIKYKKAVIEVSTSGGKTLISFILFKYLYQKGLINNMCLFVPNVTLINQTLEEFHEYESFIVNPEWKKDWISEIAGGPSKYKANETSKSDMPNLVIGTYQTITKFNKEWFSFQDCILGDEIQHITAKSVQKIYSRSYNATYKFGVSGTVHKKNEYNNFLTQSFIGPLVYTLSSSELINTKKRATPVFVVAQKLRYENIDKGSLGEFYNARLNKPKGDVIISGLIYNKERDYIRDSQERFDHIIDQIKRTKKNALVLFSDIKGSYGKKIYDELFATTDKTLFYIDGATPGNSRTAFIEEFENDETENSIIIASIGVFSEGINLKRLWNIYLVEPLKSEIILAQILGRGMRMFKDKKAVLLFDFQDSLDWHIDGSTSMKGCTSYMTRHANERNRIYKNRNFPLKHEEVFLT